MLNTIRPSIPQEAYGGGGYGVIKSRLGMLPNGWADVRPTISQSGIGGGVSGSTIKNTGKCG